MKRFPATTSVCLSLAAIVLIAACTAVREGADGKTTNALPSAGKHSVVIPDRPCYPHKFRRLGREAELIVVVEVDLEGKGKLISVPESVSDEWRAAAECLISKMSFKPTQENGQAVVGLLQLPVSFKLSQ
jgi:hypothetical protein